MINLKKECGLTLIELIVAITVLVIFTGGLYYMIFFGTSMWYRGEEKVDEQQNLRTAINKISREARMAYSYSILLDGEEVEQGEDGSELILENQEEETIRYYLSGEQIQRSINGEGHNIVAYGVDYIIFSSPANKMIDIEIEGLQGYSVNTQVFVRN